MKAHQRIIFFTLLGLLILAFAGLVLTNRWVSPGPERNAGPASSNAQASPVDPRPLETAQQLAALATAPKEHQFAQQAQQLADNEVDLAFDYALRYAAEQPVSLSAEARQFEARVKETQTSVDADQANVNRLQALVEKAQGDKKENLAADLELAKAQLALDQDELGDAHEDLIRAGGDPRANIQRLLAEHEQSVAHQGSAGASAGPNSRSAIEATTARNAVEQFRAWRSLHSKRQQLEAARQDASRLAEELTRAHQALAAEVHQSQKALSSQRAEAASPGNTVPTTAAERQTPFLRMRQLSERRKTLAEFDKRIEDEQALANVYSKWEALVQSRERMFLHGLLTSAFWILLIAVLALLASYLFPRFVSQVGAERKRLLTLRSVFSFTVKALGIVLILMVIFGLPSQLATVLALAGAGLTVALKDFIVGFFGWFVLMGRNGIRPGDWVEINGVGGEVLEVGLLHTVLLETGNWSDAGHPTGRKVTFVNSFAIEGHYFNFSTTGQWLWDEIQVLIPAGTNPYPLADAIQKTVAEATEANARLAEEEWRRVTPTHASSSFSATPAMSVRPATLGVNVVVRYLAQAHQRHEVRSRLYHSIVELLHQQKVPQAAS